MNTNRALALGVYLAAPYVLCLLLSQQQFRIWTVLLSIEAIAEVMVLLRPALCLSLAEAAAVQKDIKERKGVPAGGWDAFRVLCAACPPSWGGPQVQDDTHHLQNLAMMCVSCSRAAPGCGSRERASWCLNLAPAWSHSRAMGSTDVAAVPNSNIVVQDSLKREGNSCGRVKYSFSKSHKITERKHAAPAVFLFCH